MRYAVLAMLAMLVAGCGAQGLPEQNEHPRFYDEINADIEAHCASCHDGNRIPIPAPVFSAHDTDDSGANYEAAVRAIELLPHHFVADSEHPDRMERWQAWLDEGAPK